MVGHRAWLTSYAVRRDLRAGRTAGKRFACCLGLDTLESRRLLSAAFAGSSPLFATLDDFPALAMIGQNLPDQSLLIQSLPKNVTKVFFDPSWESVTDVLQHMQSSRILTPKK
jgi:hypothetical protein